MLLVEELALDSQLAYAGGRPAVDHPGKNIRKPFNISLTVLEYTVRIGTAIQQFPLLRDKAAVHGLHRLGVLAECLYENVVDGSEVIGGHCQLHTGGTGDGTVRQGRETLIGNKIQSSVEDLGLGDFTLLGLLIARSGFTGRILERVIASACAGNHVDCLEQERYGTTGKRMPHPIQWPIIGQSYNQRTFSAPLCRINPCLWLPVHGAYQRLLH